MELAPSNLDVRVVNPDFIRSNIIRNASLGLVIVDNEFLGIGMGFEFDILNTAKSLFPSNQERQMEYYKMYADETDYGSLLELRNFWEMCFLIKVTGKRFMQKRVAEGKCLLKTLTKKIRTL